MVKRIVLCLMGLALSSMLCGCWNYRSMDQMSIVVGIAVDFDEQNQLFELSYEVANLAGRDKKSTIPGKVIQSTGKTMFDAARNAKRRETNKLL